MFSIEFLIFFSTGLLSLFLNYFRLSITTTNQVIALFLIVLLMFVSRFFTFYLKGNKSSITNLILLFVSSLLIQFLVISTGGFFSPFLILIHLFTLGSSFLLGLASSVSFLIFSLLMLLLHTWIDQTMLVLFMEDPWSVILYIISFIVIIPLVQLLARTYNLKDRISKLLSERIQLGKIREESIMSGLSELVFVTDRNLRIVSANEAVERTQGLPPEKIIGQYLLDVVPLVDEQGHLVSSSSFFIPKVINEKATSIIRNFNMYVKNLQRPVKVNIQLRPVVDLKGDVTQIAFIITDIKKEGSHELHSYLEQARVRHKTLTEELKKILVSAPAVIQQVEMYGKAEDDLLAALEIEDHPIKKSLALYDIAQLAQQVVSAKRGFATTMGVDMQFALISNRSPSIFMAFVDIKWLDLLLRKLLDIAILLAYGQAKPWVGFSLREEDRKVIVEMRTKTPPLLPQEYKQLFTQYYGNLGAKTNLNLGSGLEGFIAKTIATELQIPLSVKFQEDYALFALTVPKSL